MSPEKIMINPKKLIEMVQKWRKVASLGRRRNGGVAQKGYFVVYSIDKKRFVAPLRYLGHNIFREIFKMSEEEFGLPIAGPITLPFDAVCMEYAISLVQRHAS